MPTKKLSIRSKCCNALWELSYVDSAWFLNCEKCGKPAKGITVQGPDLGSFGCLKNKGEH